MGRPRASQIARQGWPKLLVCLKCGQLRLARTPGDRMHPHCRDEGTEGERGAFRGGVKS